MGIQLMVCPLAFTPSLCNLLLLNHLNQFVNHHTSLLYILQVSMTYIPQFMFNIFVFQVICSVTTDKDTATMDLDTKPKVDGTFWYLLDDNEPSQQCVLIQFICKCLQFHFLLIL